MASCFEINIDRINCCDGSSQKLLASIQDKLDNEIKNLMEIPSAMRYSTYKVFLCDSVRIKKKIVKTVNSLTGSIWIEKDS